MAARDRDSCLFLCTTTHHNAPHTLKVNPTHHPPSLSTDKVAAERETRDGVPRQGTSHIPPSTSPDSGAGPNLRGEWVLFGHGNRIQPGPVWAAAQLHCAQRDGPRLCPSLPYPKPRKYKHGGPPFFVDFANPGRKTRTAGWRAHTATLLTCSQARGLLYPAHHHRCVSWLSDQTRPSLDQMTSAPLYRASGPGRSEEGPGGTERPVTIRRTFWGGRTRLEGLPQTIQQCQCTQYMKPCLPPFVSVIRDPRISITSARH